MTQPQPTAADGLSDAELIDSIEMDTGLSAGTIRDVLAALPQAGYRLTRAESAPGVTAEDGQREFHMGDLHIVAMGPSAVVIQISSATDQYVGHVIALMGDELLRVRAVIDAALTDAGTEAE